MMDDKELEERMRRLLPAPLPADLAERLADEPAIEEEPVSEKVIPWRAIVGAGLAAAACVLLFWGYDGMVGSPDEESPISVTTKESTLLGKRTLSVLEHEGQVWELAEQEWRDDVLAYCSNSPVRVQSSEIRTELVYLPVEFQ